MTFRLTYATMYDPPDELHTQFDTALVRVEASLGGRHSMFVDGDDRPGSTSVERRSPIDAALSYGAFAVAALSYGAFAVADSADVDAAVSAAAAAAAPWRATMPDVRVGLMRTVADVMQERLYDIAAALTIEVGKNRMEALGEAQEAVDFFRLYADDFERHGGYVNELPNDPVAGPSSTNCSVMRPYGVWAVIAPFNYPLALAAGPTAAALVTGNTVVLKGAPDTPWAGRLLADCVRDAGLPPGVFNYLSGSSDEAGAALVAHPQVAGLTFTGSAAVGSTIISKLAGPPWPRPCIAEMGGKNACIVTVDADLDRAAAGVVRSAYGMSGQKCSALSRLYVHAEVADELVARIVAATGELTIGDPRRRENWLGPVINQRSFDNYSRHVVALRDTGTIHVGGDRIAAPGFYVQPTLAEAPLDHPLWEHEMFVPILMLHRVADRDEAMRLANASPAGLTAGFYGSDDELDWFQDNIEAGVTYANRPQGATTGSWPGYQPFAGWKASSSTGKAIASYYYLPQYMREQSRTVVTSD